MIHSSLYRPRVFPFNGNVDPAEIDRLQELTGGVTLGRTKIEEIGREGIVGFRKSTPAVTLSARQLEYGNLEFYRKLANKTNATDTVNLSDFATDAVFDIAGYKTDQDGTFLGTVWYPKYRVNSLGLNIGDPDVLIERTFGFVGEDDIFLQNDNAFLIYKTFTATGGSPETFSITDPTATEDPDNSGNFLLRVLRVRGTTTTELIVTTDFTFDSGTGDLDITTQAGDIIKVWYSASSFISGQTPFVENDVDAAGIVADSATIFLGSGNEVFRLQSIGIEITFDRQDVREIGNEDVVQRGIRDTTVRVTLGRILEQYTIEEILRGVAGSNFGKIDVRKFQDDNFITVKVFEDSTKTNFKLGYKFSDLAAVGIDAGVPLNDFVTQGVTLEGEEGFVSDNESNL